MGLILILLGLWTPKYILRSELDKVSTLTTNTLKELLQTPSPVAIAKTSRKEPTPKSLQEKRAAMAKEHTILVEALAKTLGREEAVNLGRKALFKAGEQLGKETRQRLGVSDSSKDLIRAAKILYRVLGISFKVEWQGPTNATLTVDPCELAKNYSELTCIVLSATDEGVVKGLNPNVNMKFEERITGGYNCCIARINQNK